MNNSNLKILAINGAPGSGKTTFENMLAKEMGRYYDSRSTIDLVKQVAKLCGWDGTKDLKSRKFLSDLKDLLTEYNDAPMNDIKQHINNFEEELTMYYVVNQPHIFVSDVREPRGLQRFKDELNAITVLVRRPEVEGLATSNHADAEVFNFNYDYIIYNDSTLEVLEARAKTFLKLLFPEN